MEHYSLSSTQKEPFKVKTRGTDTIRYIWLAFFFWPLLGFLLAWYHIRTKGAKYIILAFYFLYGLLYVINLAMDGARRADRLSEAHKEPLSNVFFYINNLYESTVDFLDPVIIYFVSRFSDFHGFLFGTYALIFGSLSLKFIQNLSRRYINYPMNKNALFFFILLVWTNFIFQIGGFRMWTAAWIFSLSTLYYLTHRKIKFIVIAGISLLMHFSFIPLILLLLAYHFLGNKPSLYGVLALGSFLVADLDVVLLQDYSSNLGSAIERKVAAYTDENYMQGRFAAKEQYVWFMSIGPKLLSYFTYVSLGYLYSKTKGVTKDSVFNGLFSLALLFMAFSNISSLLPSGGRFRVVFYTFAFASLFVYYLKFEKKYSLIGLNWIGLPIAMLYILIKFRIATDTISLYLIAPSLVMPFGFYDSVPLKDFLF